MSKVIQLRRDIASEWTAANPILAEGEIGIEKDASTPRWKYGDGVTAWSALPYFVPLNSANPSFTVSLTAPQLISNVATGTAPLQVASTTMVANLNTEQVGGMNATALQTQALLYAIIFGG